MPVTKHGLRSARVGDSNGMARFTDNEVEQMRQLDEGGMARKDIAQRFGCSKGYVTKVCNYELRAAAILEIRTVPGNNENRSPNA